MIENDLFLRACRRQPVDRLPVWYMRQAGRYQPEYRRIKERHSLVGICEQPELCAQVTMLPVQQLGVDAAILFSDIMIPVGAMGVPFDIEADRGPVIHRPVRTQDDVRRLAEVDPESDLPHVLETIRLLRNQLTIPLIGFAGGPFTLASYMIEGAPSREHLLTKGMMYGDPQTWRQLMDRLASMIVAYMRAQVH
ncbi:MAG: uroporphyrinogen decarboxylase family protein, partial [Bacilli bacterium]